MIKLLLCIVLVPHKYSLEWIKGVLIIIIVGYTRLISMCIMSQKYFAYTTSVIILSLIGGKPMQEEVEGGKPLTQKTFIKALKFLNKPSKFKK